MKRRPISGRTRKSWKAAGKGYTIMNCANHQEVQATAFCRECGRPMCGDCQCRALGSVYCAEHAPATIEVPRELPPMIEAPPPPAIGAPPPPRDYRAFASASASTSAPAADPSSSPYTAPEPRPAVACDTNASPLLALFLGFIPGVGAIYNGQYAKGLIHAVVFGALVTIGSRGGSGLEPLVGITTAAWVFYMAFEAFHTAKMRRRGQRVEEFSSLLEVHASHGRFPMGAVLLIGLGFVLLLDTTEIIDMEQLMRYWPVGLIVLGVYMLYGRVSSLPSGVRPAAEGQSEAEARR
jgi:hypothetical protein